MIKYWTLPVPSFMKIAPLMRAMAGHPEIQSKLIQTGQHYNDEMSKL